MMKTNNMLPLQLNSVLIGIMLSVVYRQLLACEAGKAREVYINLLPGPSCLLLRQKQVHGTAALLRSPLASGCFAHTRVCERSNCFARSKARRLGGAYAMQVSLQIASLEAGGQRSNCFARSNSTRSQWQAGKSEVENLALAINTKLNIYTCLLQPADHYQIGKINGF